MYEKISFSALIDTISIDNKITKTFARSFVREMALVIEEGLKRDRFVRLSGFGTFKLKEVPERQGRNVQTGEPIVIPAHNKVMFKPEKQLREVINKKYTHLKTQILPNDLLTGQEIPGFDLLKDKAPKTLSTLVPPIPESEEKKPEVTKKPEPEIKDENAHFEKETENLINDPPDDDEKKFSKMPIYLSLLAILIILFFYIDFGDDEQKIKEPSKSTPEKIESKKKDAKKELQAQVEKQKIPAKTKKIAKVEKMQMETHTLNNGDTLWELAVKKYNDGYLWPLIFAENTDIVTNPNLLEPGLKLKIPKIDKDAKSGFYNKKISNGHLLAYFSYKKQNKAEAINHLFVANKYDSDFVSSKSSQIDATDLATIKSYK